MNDRLIIIGASGHGKVVADIAEKMGKYKQIALLDDNGSIETCNDFPVIGKSNDADKYLGDTDFFVAIGNAEIRRKLFDSLVEKGAKIPVLIHPDAVIGKNVSIDIGTVVMAGVVINSETEIGKGCIINTSASVDHDCKIHDYVHVSVGAHIAGTVEIGDNTWLGIGSTVSNNVAIAKNSIIGAGAVVIKDIPENCVAVGAPAKPIKFKE